jgi:hypothetical protein
MATQLDVKELDLQEQIARIAKIQEDIDRSRAEMHRMNGVAYERELAEIDRIRLDAAKLRSETQFMPRSMIFQAMLATAALLAAGAAMAKLFFP